jgi:hypothetical protein
MTEEEWLTCSNPTLMLEWLRGRVSERKARLHACACCRRRMRPDLDRRGWQAVEVAERYAEGRTATSADSPYFDHSDAFGDHAVAEAALLHDIVGSPFLSMAFDSAWRTRTVVSLAEAAYEERLAPPHYLDPTRLAVLADALEEVGCTDQAILDHLRGSGQHVRGCWAVDLVLAHE